MTRNRSSVMLLVALAAASSLAAGRAYAADVVVQPASNSAFVVKDAAGATDRLRVLENGAVTIPSFSLGTDLFGVVNPGTGRAGFFQRGSGSGVSLGQTEAIRGDNSSGPGIAGTSSASVGVYGTSLSTHGLWGVAVVAGAAGVEGRNDAANGFGVEGVSLGGGAGVHGQSQTGPAGQFDVSNAASTAEALVVNQAGLGRGVHVTVSNAASTASVIRGDTAGTGFAIHGTATGDGTPAYFSIPAASNTATTVTAITAGTGGGVSVQLSNPANGARGVDVLQAGTGTGIFSTSSGGIAVWGVANSISAAGVIGDNTLGEAVVGRNRGGSGVGAVVGRNDDAGYGVRGFNTKDGIGVIGEAGLSGGTGIAGYFQNINASNGSYALGVTTNGTGPAARFRQSNPGEVNVLEVHSAGTGNIAVFSNGAGNVARIDNAGKGFFNGGTQTGGADVAELIPTTGRLPEPGDVVEIDPGSPLHYRLSSRAVSRSVAGVVTTKPGVLMNAGVEDASGPALALVGRVPVRVTDENGAIAPGDLLVSSSTPGHAMLAPENVRAGSVIGKALQGHESGTGVVEMLVMLR